MYQTFENLPDDKQLRILNAVCEEFAKKGYKNASTNDMVRGAGISKGSLFHYFPTKRALYLYVYDHLSKVMLTEFYRMKDFEEKDLFLILRKSSLIKYEIYKRYPQIYKFFLTAYFEEDPEIKEDLQKRNGMLIEDTYHTLFESIDTTRFRPDLDAKTAFNIVIWSLEGLGRKFEVELDFDHFDEEMFRVAMAEMDHYLTLLESLIYVK